MKTEENRVPVIERRPQRGFYYTTDGTYVIQAGDMLCDQVPTETVAKLRCQFALGLRGVPLGASSVATWIRAVIPADQDKARTWFEARERFAAKRQT